MNVSDWCICCFLYPLLFPVQGFVFKMPVTVQNTFSYIRICNKGMFLLFFFLFFLLKVRLKLVITLIESLSIVVHPVSETFLKMPLKVSLLLSIKQSKTKRHIYYHDWQRKAVNPWRSRSQQCSFLRFLLAKRTKMINLNSWRLIFPEWLRSSSRKMPLDDKSIIENNQCH